MQERRAREFPKEHHENEVLRAAIVANPDSDELRWEYAAWIRAQPSKQIRYRAGGDQWEVYESSTNPLGIAWLIETQLEIAGILRENPRADVRPLWKLRDGTPIDHRPSSYLHWEEWDFAPFEGIAVRQGIYRGFIEHVAMRANFFLECAEELFEIEPIRHITLTYCKEQLPALLASPHLARMRSLSLPSRYVHNRYMRLNDWSDDDVCALAACPQLANVRYLNLDDAVNLTPRAFIALARSPHLAKLSHVQADCYRYFQAFGIGENRRELVRRTTERFRAEIEAACGYVPWLHPEEHYGSAEPDLEAVTEHPVALDPEVAARRGRPVPSGPAAPPDRELSEAARLQMSWDAGGADDEIRDPYMNPFPTRPPRT